MSVRFVACNPNRMKLAAIYNVWADYDWARHSIENIAPLVDGVILIWSEKSNYGEYCKPQVVAVWGANNLPEADFHTYQYEPALLHAMHAETRKRNYGLEKAAELGYTHFLSIDCDELYDPEEFLREKQRFIDKPDLQGLVCRTQVYVKSPTLTIGLDRTLVPFIQKITPTLKHEFNKKYPYAWDEKGIRIDPTRSTNATSGIEWSDIIMHHFSHCRKDYARKIRNSTAKANLERMNLANKIVHLKEGDIFDLYPGKPLVRVPNRFAIPEYGEYLAEDGNI